jgi:hypothetical protein
MERAIKWMPKREIDSPCADISFTWVSAAHARLVVTMHFSRVVNGPPEDLQLSFTRPLAVAWEEETFGLIDSPEDLPKCTGAHLSRFTHPTLIVEGSRWAERYAANMFAEGDPGAKRVTHYFMVSLNDLLHVLAESEPEAAWVPSIDA